DAAADNGDTVSVEPGTYSGTGNVDLDFGIKNIELRSSSGYGATIIDIEDAIGHRAIDFYDGGQDTTCVVDGFTILDGRMGTSGSDGAGIRCYAAGPKIVNCRFESNRCSGKYGGAIFCDDGSHPVIRDCIFVENIAYRGGAVYCDSGSRPKFSNCLFQNNEGGDEAGALYLGFQCDASVVRCLFVGNTTECRGGAMTCSEATPSLSNCAFLRNIGDVTGGAAHLKDQSYAVFFSCTFVGNSASEEGGCLHVNTNSYPTIYQCIFAFTGPCDDSTIFVDGTSEPSIMWSCSYSNAPGDILPTASGNYIIADPLFCDVTIDELTLAQNSQCLPGNNGFNKLIGAFGEGCVQSTAEERTWGSIKAMYR
ncbi:right-handed parallel beta-helix repeat-containing protein, partial [bacterium]|nr:right-handed parallel beta-helix repeat-containing protein [bacterium]